MTVREDALRLRVKEAKRPKGKKQWAAPEISDFAKGIIIMAIDQSLGNTGVVIMRMGDDGAHITARWTYQPKGTAKGHLGSLQKATDLFDYLVLRDSVSSPLDLVVYEQTPIMGYRLESSLLAGLTVMLVHRDAQAYSRQSAYSLLLAPDRRSEKKFTREVVERYVVEDLTHRKTWNEHERDALMLGLTGLHIRYSKTITGVKP